MTLTSQIISDAYRQSNLIAVGASPTTAESTEALRYLNRLVKSSLGDEVGEPLTAIPIGGANIGRPAGYPWYGTIPDQEWFVPKNTRVVFNLAEPVDLYLHPAPNDGSRFAVTDPGETLATYNATIHGNGQRIDGELSISLYVNGYDAQWVYRADLAEWLIYAPLLEDTVFPFPEEFDDYFITLLAIRLNPSYGATLDDQSNMIFQRAGKQLKARYAQVQPVRSELALIRPARAAADRDQWGSMYDFYDPNVMFDKGWPN